MMTGHEHNADTLIQDGIKALPPLEMNIEDFRDDLSGLELSEEEANELLTMIWKIMSTMVDMGWGVDVTHIVLPELFEKSCKDDEKSLYKH